MKRLLSACALFSTGAIVTSIAAFGDITNAVKKPYECGHLRAQISPKRMCVVACACACLYLGVLACLCACTLVCVCGGVRACARECPRCER